MIKLIEKDDKILFKNKINIFNSKIKCIYEKHNKQNTSSRKAICKNSTKSKKLSKCLLDAMCGKAKVKNRGLMKRDDLTGTNWAKMPVTLIEVGFMTNPKELANLTDENYQKKCARAIYEGIMQALEEGY